jgi:hypothetical protein
VDLNLVYWIWVYFKIEVVEPLLQKDSRSASFGAKVVPSLQRADLSFMNSVTGSVCRAKCSNLSYRIITRGQQNYTPCLGLYLKLLGTISGHSVAAGLADAVHRVEEEHFATERGDVDDKTFSVLHHDS